MKKLACKAQADRKHCRARGYHQYLKKSKSKAERRKANANPETPPAYNRYCGWES